MSKWRFKGLSEVFNSRASLLKDQYKKMGLFRLYFYFVLYSITTVLLLKFSQIVLNWAF
jgi:hypothetical protein